MLAPPCQLTRHSELRDRIQSFLGREVVPYANKWEAQAHMPSNLLRQCGEQGFLGLSLPQATGGQGEDIWAEVVLTEELARTKALGWALSIMAHTNMVAPLLQQLGTPEQQQEVLVPALAGDFYLGLAATEKHSGSDLLATQTTAEYQDQTYRVNGEKCYISNGSVARHLITLVRHQSARGAWSLSLLIIPTDLEGVRSNRLKTSGLRSGDTAEVSFDNCLVPSRYLLGKSNDGFYYLLKGLQRERLIGAIAMNSIAAYVIDETIANLKQKQRGGSPLSQKQAIRHRLAELSASTEASRQFCYATCQAYSLGEPTDTAIAMLKIVSYENSQKVIRDCCHLFGAEAFLEEHWLGRLSRDANAFTLAAGSSEIMRDLVAGMIRV